MMYTGKQLRALVMPLMFEQFLNVMVGMVDTLMVSKAGEAAVSGVALTTNINLLIIQVMAALATGGAVVCSQYNGRRDTKDACLCGRTVGNGVVYFLHGSSVYLCCFWKTDVTGNLWKCRRFGYAQCMDLYVCNGTFLSISWNL